MGRMSPRGGRMNVDLRKNQGDFAALEYNVDEVSSDTDVRFMSALFQCLLTDSVFFFPHAPLSQATSSRWPLPLYELCCGAAALKSCKQHLLQ